ncbi:MAG: response regulator [Rickettsiella sp.]|nr:response regulator [Rickettsiella sp.]
MSPLKLSITRDSEVNFDTLIPSIPCSALETNPLTLAPMILSIDDNKICQKVNETILKKFGCFVELAGTSNEALQKMVKPYEMIFLEARLPDHRGEAFIDLIRYDERSANKKTPIVIITSWIESTLNKKYFSREIDAIFIKPILRHEFKTILQKYGVI